MGVAVPEEALYFEISVTPQMRLQPIFWDNFFSRTI